MNKLFDDTGEVEICKICHSPIDDNGVPLDCAGECARQVVPSYDLPPDKELDFNEDTIISYDDLPTEPVDQPVDYDPTTEEYDDWYTP